jgi:hypothetical protein
MLLSALVQELGQEWELEAPLPQNMPGVFTIPLDEGVTLSFSTAPQGGIYISSAIAPVMKGTEEQLFTQALLANLFGQGTRGAVLGLNENGTLLTLSQLIEYDIDFKEFRDIVEDFINTVDFWRDETLKLG